MGNGGEGGIRTHEGLAPLPVFKTGAFNRSATPPVDSPSYLLLRVDEWLLMQQANHGRDSFLNHPEIFVIERPIRESFDDIGSFLDGVFDVG